ncbi:hypothetical protein SERLA73DRAFT_162732 [Serpula lacrymans var. lacrymans S7.3]|uniref:Methyltransferase domain-containing protein n=2 Tax=Serpula lacrymans var. lacrymans TaxID=341189 RepID=F8Q9F2_SERL3|nr:uncharacterized protein SERLADRAFT_417868 [Serpula lacrymans var. lacrymans S7.9]EGN95207.1 hypothetical protein SERLA73DRAFT_162732 [Serpula lacrymans var. lacrymans S7.3]EGO20734.1 hypothetical protein SERLADRAFT_417868 [Serpula lacrymans var. lacrymans S7.9]
MTVDPKEIVRKGYDAISHLYCRDNYEGEGSNQKMWVSQLLDILPPPPAQVLDLGCGCGVPASRDLALAGYTVTGVDISKVQIERAKKLVPQGTFIQSDISSESLADILPPSAQFAAVIALYVLIHIPIEEQPALIRRIGEWIQEGGYCAMVVGIRPWTGEVGGWLGASEDVKMWWSQASVDDYRKWSKDASFEIVRDEQAKDLMPNDSEVAEHQFLLLKKHRVEPMANL